MAKKNLGMQITMGIALALILFGLFNLGVETFYPSPEYSDYCGDRMKFPERTTWTEQECIGENGIWLNGFCDLYSECQGEYDEARDEYNNVIFYVFVIAGLILAITGLFIVYLPFQIVGIGTGTLLMIEGIFRNLENRIPAFIVGVLIFIILSYFVWKRVGD